MHKLKTGEELAENQNTIPIRVILVRDHSHDLTGALLNQVSGARSREFRARSGRGTINGMNVRNCDARPHQGETNSSVNTQTFKLEKYHIHSLQTINVGAFVVFQIRIDGHDFAVTEVEGYIARTCLLTPA